ncbi:hypothetical protein HYH03_017106 [Edaphochlamys debaryana]|uniref:Autophagy-related protein 13 N-terminal domain-containing protein n=1 Tax=Edaphochlamys debaryana TaxID=47281 RepID=A0A835XJ38_9CHLO|nr:hypothetical protein HYH03_017106 [Edaphochlamys debaryana]|eukprot:KAG2484087.1 hypothetical protein HYH03_017106 [Edaphochlamys debaryana]
MADRLTIEHYIGEAFVKCGQVILGGRVLTPSAQQQARPARDRRASRWFLLELDDLEGVGREVELWRKDISSPLVVEILMGPAPPAPGAGASRPAPPGIPEGETLLERWTLAFTRSGAGGGGGASSGMGMGMASSMGGGGGGAAGGQGARSYVDEASVYKRLIILIRSLYSFSRILPAYKICRAARRLGGELPLTVFARVSRSAHAPGGGHELQPRLSHFVFAPVDTAGGQFRVAVQYNPTAAAVLSYEQQYSAAAAPVSTPYTINENYLAPSSIAAVGTAAAVGPQPSTSAPASSGMARPLRSAMSALSGVYGSMTGRGPPGSTAQGPTAISRSPSHNSTTGTAAAAAASVGGGPTGSPAGPGGPASGGGATSVAAAGGDAGAPRPIVRHSWSSKEMRVSFSLPPPLGSPGGGVSGGGAGGGGPSGSALHRRSSSGYNSAAGTPPLRNSSLPVAAAGPGAQRPPPGPGYHRCGSAGAHLASTPPSGPPAPLAAFASPSQQRTLAAAEGSAAAEGGVGGGGSGSTSVDRTTSAPVSIPTKPSSRTRSVNDLRAPAVMYGGFEVHPAVAAAALSSSRTAAAAAAAMAAGLAASQDGAVTDGDAAAAAAHHKMAPGSAPAAPRGMLGLALGALKPGASGAAGGGGSGAGKATAMAAAAGAEPGSASVILAAKPGQALAAAVAAAAAAANFIPPDGAAATAARRPATGTGMSVVSPSGRGGGGGAAASVVSPPGSSAGSGNSSGTALAVVRTPSMSHHHTYHQHHFYHQQRHQGAGNAVQPPPYGNSPPYGITVPVAVPPVGSMPPYGYGSPQLPFAFTPSAQSMSLASLHQAMVPLGYFGAPSGGTPRSAAGGAAGAGAAGVPVSGRDITALATIRRPSWSSRSGSLDPSLASAGAPGAHMGGGGLSPLTDLLDSSYSNASTPGAAHSRGGGGVGGGGKGAAHGGGGGAAGAHRNAGPPSGAVGRGGRQPLASPGKAGAAAAASTAMAGAPATGAAAPSGAAAAPGSAAAAAAAGRETAMAAKAAGPAAAAAADPAEPGGGAHHHVSPYDMHHHAMAYGPYGPYDADVADPGVFPLAREDSESDLLPFALDQEGLVLSPVAPAARGVGAGGRPGGPGAGPIELTLSFANVARERDVAVGAFVRMMAEAAPLAAPLGHPAAREADGAAALAELMDLAAQIRAALAGPLGHPPPGTR